MHGWTFAIVVQREFLDWLLDTLRVVIGDQTVGGVCILESAGEFMSMTLITPGKCSTTTLREQAFELEERVHFA